MQAAASILVQKIQMTFQIGDQCRTVGFSLLRLSKAIEFQSNVFQAQLFPQRIRQQDQFGIDFGPMEAHGFRTDLMKLPVASALRPLMAEHRAHVIQALAAVVQQRMLGRGTNDARRRLGAQRQMLPIQAVFEGIHFLFDNIGDLAQAANEQCCRFYDGRTHIAISVSRHERPHLVFQPLPARRVRGKNVVHAFDGHQFAGFGLRIACLVAHGMHQWVKDWRVGIGRRMRRLGRRLSIQIREGLPLG